jgi:hypothetical protein
MIFLRSCDEQMPSPAGMSRGSLIDSIFSGPQLFPARAVRPRGLLLRIARRARRTATDAVKVAQEFAEYAEVVAARFGFSADGAEH